MILTPSSGQNWQKIEIYGWRHAQREKSMLILSVQPDATPSKSFENAAFGLAACQNIGINIIPTTQLPKMAERSKKSVFHFYPGNLPKKRFRPLFRAPKG